MVNIDMATCSQHDSVYFELVGRILKEEIMRCTNSKLRNFCYLRRENGGIQYHGLEEYAHFRLQYYTINIQLRSHYLDSILVLQTMPNDTHSPRSHSLQQAEPPNP